MSVCLGVYIYTCVCVCMSTCVCVYPRVGVPSEVLLHVSAFVGRCFNVYIFVCVYMCVICVSLCFMYMFECMCVYVYL